MTETCPVCGRPIYVRLHPTEGWYFPEHLDSGGAEICSNSGAPVNTYEQEGESD